MQAKQFQGTFPSAGLKFPKERQKPPFQTFEQIERRIEQEGLCDIEAAELWETLFLTAVEIESLLDDVIESARHHVIAVMIATAAHAGARRSELIRSQRRDFDLEAGVMTIREKKRKRGQQTYRQVPLTGHLHSLISEWFKRHPGGSDTFCLKPKTPLTVNQATDYFKWSLSGKWSRVRGWHTLRHSFASNCAAAGVDQRILDEWMGHQTEEMTRRYRHLFPDQQRTALKQVFPGT